MASLVRIELEELEAYVAQALSSFPQVAAAYLFGSCLDRCRPDSDIDLAVVLPLALVRTEKDREQWEARISTELRAFDGHPFDLTIFNPEQTIFAFHIISKGQTVFIRDSDLVTDLMEYVSRQYEEVNYRYQRALAEVLDEVGSGVQPPGVRSHGH